ncbi:hypothetical protein J6590_093908 [Homalodisca vitripennis]|nr:hypothetical protein J6590_093908 [Homalodisca vitripennis]
MTAIILVLIEQTRQVAAEIRSATGVANHIVWERIRPTKDKLIVPQVWQTISSGRESGPRKIKINSLVPQVWQTIPSGRESGPRKIKINSLVPQVGKPYGRESGPRSQN